MPNTGLISVGDNSARIISNAPAFDPETGWTSTLILEGEEDSLIALMAQYAGLGLRCRPYQFAGPVWRADILGVPQSEEQTGLPEIVDQWEIDTQMVQESIYSNPKVQAAFNFDNAQISLASSLIEEAISKHRSLEEFKADNTGPIPGQTDALFDLYSLRSMGQQATEVERCVLSRNRTIPIQHAQRATQDAVPRTYTTAALIDLFGVPSYIQNLLPTTPASANPLQTWAWKKQVDRATIIPQVNKCLEVRQWVFASWSNATYILVT